MSDQFDKLVEFLETEKQLACTLKECLEEPKTPPPSCWSYWDGRSRLANHILTILLEALREEKA